MFRVEERPDPIESLVLEDTEARSVVVIAPSRGGLVTRFSVADHDVLYMDDASLRDPAKNVRGGIPVLFPTPGKLDGDAWSRDGQTGSQKQHGFARNLAWEVTHTSSDGAAACTLQLASNDATRGAWPWTFTLEHRLSLRGAALRINQRVCNLGDTPMPFGLGFHPYFLVPDADKAAARVATQATRAFDNVTKQNIDLVGIDLAQSEVDLHLLDHGSSECALASRAGEVQLRCSPSYKRWVIWTLAGRDFVCLEPWTSPGNAMNTGVGLIRLAPGAKRDSFVEIAWAPA